MPSLEPDVYALCAKITTCWSAFSQRLEVCFGSTAPFRATEERFRFFPDSGHLPAMRQRKRWAKGRHTKECQQLTVREGPAEYYSAETQAAISSIGDTNMAVVVAMENFCFSVVLAVLFLWIKRYVIRVTLSVLFPLAIYWLAFQAVSSGQDFWDIRLIGPVALGGFCGAHMKSLLLLVRSA